MMRKARFQPALGGTLHLSRTNAFFLGGGKALLNAYYRTASPSASRPVRRRFAASTRDGRFHWPPFNGARVARFARTRWSRPRAGSRETRRVEGDLGAAADNFIIRGTPYDTGTVLRLDRPRVKTVGILHSACGGGGCAFAAFRRGHQTWADCVSLDRGQSRRGPPHDEGQDLAHALRSGVG
jgi:tricarballylate dehydrogenase